MATAAPPRGANPFDDSGVRAGTGGVRRYPGLHASLLEMLRDSMQAAPGAEALAEVGGRRISYGQLRLTNVAGLARAWWPRKAAPGSSSARWPAGLKPS